MYTGIGASAGIGIGSAVIVKEPSLAYDNKAVSDVDAEKQRLTYTCPSEPSKTTLSPLEISSVIPGILSTAGISSARARIAE